MENSPELKALIRKNAHMFWYTKEEEKENLPLPVVLEFFLNYGDEQAVRSIIEVIGNKKAATVFFEQVKTSVRLANNYDPVSKNFFSLYFKKYAS